MLSLYKLEIFAAVVQEGSFSAAAERLLMTQPAVSQHIQSLEASLGTALFERGRRGVTLTASGETLYTYTCDILQLVAEAENKVTNVDHVASGQIRIGATPGVSVYLLPDWMRPFQERYPQLTTSLQTAVTESVLKDVLKSRVDIGFVEGEMTPDSDARLGNLVLCAIDLYVVIGRNHRWWPNTEVAIDELHDESFITRPGNSHTRAWIDGLLSAHGVKPHVVAEFDNPESIKQAVVSGMGITILPYYAIETEQQRDMLRGLTVAGLPLVRQLSMVWRQDAPLMPITRAFLAGLADRFAQIGPLLTM